MCECHYVLWRALHGKNICVRHKWRLLTNVAMWKWWKLPFFRFCFASLRLPFLSCCSTGLLILHTRVNSLLSFYAVVSCADPGKVEHSRRVLSGPHFTVGSTIQYVCNKGFILSGNSLLTCFNRGSSGPKWNQKLPRCLRMYHSGPFHTCTVSMNIPGNDLGGLYMWTQIPCFCLGFTFPAPLLSRLGSLKVVAESGRG